MLQNVKISCETEVAIVLSAEPLDWEIVVNYLNPNKSELAEDK